MYTNGISETIQNIKTIFFNTGTLILMEKDGESEIEIRDVETFTIE